jgi:hypothetical protein
VIAKEYSPADFKKAFNQIMVNGGHAELVMK